MSTMKVLIIDDDPDFVEVTKLRLAASGYKVFTASGGTEGLRQAKALPPDLILLDLMMPEIDGGEVGQALKADPQLRSIPIVYITALISRNEAARRNASAPVERFLSKTASPAELLNMIATALAPKK